MERHRSIAGGALRALEVWAAGLVLAIAMTWPLARGLDHLGRTRDAADARFSVWNVAWVAHALTTNPGAVYDANIFYPHRRTLAYSEANLVAGALAAPIWWLTRNPFTSHNVVLLFAFASSVVAMWYLVRWLVGDPFAAGTAAITYSFCPYLFSHTTHIQLLMTAGLPLSMLALHVLVDRPSIGRGIALGLALAVTALSCAYYGIFAALMIGYATIFYACMRGAWRSVRYWTAIAVGAVVSLGLVVPFFLPYLSIQETGFARTLNEARIYAATWRSYLASSAVAHRWMLPLIRDWGGEVLFPGFAALIFGAIGIGALARRHAIPERVSPSTPPRETALLYGSMGIVAFWATLGPRAGLYTVLYELVPVFSFLRAPGRMGLVVMLCLAVFAAFGVSALRARYAAKGALAVGVIACGVAIVDLAQAPFPWLPAHPIPQSYAVLARLPTGPLAEFPFYDRRHEYHLHTSYMLNSTAHWLPLVNGYSDHIPQGFRDLAVRLGSFPSRDAIQALRQKQVRYLTIHKDRYSAPARADVERRLQEFLPDLKLLAQDDRVAIYELAAVQLP